MKVIEYGEGRVREEVKSIYQVICNSYTTQAVFYTEIHDEEDYAIQLRDAAAALFDRGRTQEFREYASRALDSINNQFQGE